MRLALVAITIYAGPYVGRPLYCDRPASPCVYDPEAVTAWIALDVKEYESGRARCGDIVYLFGDGWELRVIALDAGLFAGRTADGLPIGGDLPAHLVPFRGTSSWAVMVNVSAQLRELTEAIGQKTEFAGEWDVASE